MLHNPCYVVRVLLMNETQTTQKAQFTTVNGYEVIAYIEKVKEQYGGGFIVKSTTDDVLQGFNETRCDFCNVNRNRTRNWVFAKDGERFVVGTGCAKQFLGSDELPQEIDGGENKESSAFSDNGDRWIHHLVEASLMTMVIEDESYTEIKNDEQESGNKFGSRVRRVWLHDGPKNWDSIKKARITTFNDTLGTECDEHGYDGLGNLVLSVIEWAKNLEGDNDFATNMRTVANMTLVPVQHHGIAFYMVEGFRREFAKWIQVVAKATEQENRNSIPTELLEGRHEITGNIIKAYTKVDGFGERNVMVVEDHRGFQVWGTNIMEAEINDEVTFIATICQSDEDPTFGFFKRPKQK